MSWCAKPSGSYISSGKNTTSLVLTDEGYQNLIEIYNYLSGLGWTIEAIAGMCGNFVVESEMNPWRWQGDTVSYTAGYGLPQFTPASGYITDYGTSAPNFSPNLSVSEQTDGATPEDGEAQLYVIHNDLAGKFINRTSYCDFYDISGSYPMSSYRTVTDLYEATLGWFFHYEGSAIVLSGTTEQKQTQSGYRYNNAVACYNYLVDYLDSGGSGGETGGGDTGEGGETGGGDTDDDDEPSVTPSYSGYTRRKMPVWLLSLRHPSRY